MESSQINSPWKVAPGHFGSSIDNIIVIENFIDKSDLLEIQQFCPTIDEWDNLSESVYAEDGTCLYDSEYWSNRHCSTEILSKLSPRVWSLIDKYVEKMKLEIESRFNCKLMSRPPAIIKWKPGTEQKPHADKQLNDGNPNAFVDYDINSLFYYNDDFEGGELYYPLHDISIKPKPGMAVVHPGDVNYLHGVSMITSGFRYTTPSFYSIVELYE